MYIKYIKYIYTYIDKLEDVFYMYLSLKKKIKIFWKNDFKFSKNLYFNCFRVKAAIPFGKKEPKKEE